MLERLKFSWFEALVVLLILLIAAVDEILLPQFSLWVVYMLPVGLAGWMVGARFGLVAATLAAIIVAIGGLLVGHHFISDEYFMYALASRWICYMLVAWLCSRWRRTQELEHQVQAYEELCDNLHIGPPRRDASQRSMLDSSS